MENERYRLSRFAFSIFVFRFQFCVFVAVLFLTISASAHPLGNFSVNQYSRLEVGKNQIKIRQILDLAEIPTFQEKTAIDTDKNGAFSEAELNAYAGKSTPQMLANLILTVDREPLELRAESKEIQLERGRGQFADAENQVEFDRRFSKHRRE